MRILFLDQSASPGGAELCLLDIAKAYREQSLVCLFEDGPMHLSLQAEGIAVKILGAQDISVKKSSGWVQGLGSFRQILPLAKQIATLSQHYDLIYANTPKALVVGALASHLGRCPLVYHLHDILCKQHFSPFNQQLLVVLANQSATKVIANSQATAQAFITAGGRAELLDVVYNGFDLEQYRYLPQPSPLQALISTPSSAESYFRIGNFSRIADWKGQHVLIEALQYCPNNVIAILVGDVLFGEQAYFQALQAKIAALHLQHRVHWAGFQSDIVPLMSACQLIVHTPTAPEPFGRVVAEAMLCKIPVIAAAAGGPLEFVKPGQTGWLVPPNNPQELAAAIHHCYQHYDAARAIAHQGYCIARETFDLHKTNQEIQQILQSVVTPASETALSHLLCYGNGNPKR